MCLMESRDVDGVPLCGWGLQENCACYKSDSWHPYKTGQGQLSKQGTREDPSSFLQVAKIRKRTIKRKNTHYNKSSEVRLGKININRNTFYSLPTYAKEGGIMARGVLEIHGKRLSFALSHLYVLSNPMIKGQCILLFDGILFNSET